MRPFHASSAAVLLLAFSAAAACAGVEPVLVRQCREEDAVVQRFGGDLWKLLLSRRCLSLQSYVGRVVLVQTQAEFPGPELLVLLPDLDLACRVFRADFAGRAAPPPVVTRPEAGLAAMRETLEAMGYYCGALAVHGWTFDAALAFTRYREGRRLDGTEHGLRRAVTSIAIDALGGRRPSGSGLRRSTLIAGESEEIVSYLERGGSVECGEPTFVRGVAADSSYFTLLDGSVWDVLPARRAAVATWLAGDGIVICNGRFVNLRTGEMARATRLR